MRIQMQTGSTQSELCFDRWDHAVMGDAVDARGEAAIEFAKANSNANHTFRYNPKALKIEFDGSQYSAEEPELVFDKFANKSVLLEATTLGFVEILLCCRALKQVGQGAVTLIYTEPKNYYQPRRSEIAHRRDFELTHEVENFMAVPGNTLLLSTDRPIKTVVFLGYEGQRLNRFMEQTGIPASKYSIVFGVPAFHPGWEMDAFSNNLLFLKGEQMAGKIHFCGAQNPLSAYLMIENIYKSCNAERLLITPIGTKPHGIGSALFLCEHLDVGVIYDNPKRKKGRSDSVETWHIFRAEF
jgi:hypothetical protein